MPRDPLDSMLSTPLKVIQQRSQGPPLKHPCAALHSLSPLWSLSLFFFVFHDPSSSWFFSPLLLVFSFCSFFNSGIPQRSLLALLTSPSVNSFWTIAAFLFFVVYMSQMSSRSMWTPVIWMLHHLRFQHFLNWTQYLSPTPNMFILPCVSLSKALSSILLSKLRTSKSFLTQLSQSFSFVFHLPHPLFTSSLYSIFT